MRRGEIWTVAGGGDYASKPRPALILQDDHFDTDSITVCLFTSDPTDAPLFRLEIAPSPTNGLDSTSRLMLDKITTVHRRRLGSKLGVLSDADLLRVNRGIMVFLGIAGTS
ncbi:MAG TPA: type II toxin-antitoxin system PemK/MazF family toxin [Jatrophihabitans sp.]|uniref:type II toxin-antitoxin system PemK/MazF family toxin n=1 Tax=Jatrophihabitans sp. TaxID=1932789 RepID=UPI002F23BA6E